MNTRLYTHAACLQHNPGPAHPESSQRLEAVLEALDADRFPALERVEAPLADLEQLQRVHSVTHVQRMLELSPESGHVSVDADTVLSPHSVEAARRACGAACAGVDALMSGAATRVFCAVRPPGHHATRERAMGFCLFNGIAVAAAHALAEHGLERVGLVDFDVHHGNGSQEIFWDETRVMYLSSHQMPLYPGTGSASEHGAGNIINAPLAPGADSAMFRRIWNETLLPALAEFRPQLILVSAGFDGHRLDPLAHVNLETEDYAWITRQLVRLADQHAGGRVLSILEGGYSLDALRESVPAHVTALGNL